MVDLYISAAALLDEIRPEEAEEGREAFNNI
jgi:hypothetical protein